MGTYYYAIDYYDKKFFSAPGSYADKAPGIFAPGNPFPNMVVMENIYGMQYIIKSDFYMDVPPDEKEGWEDVTNEVYERYLKQWGTDEEKEEHKRTVKEEKEEEDRINKRVAT